MPLEKEERADCVVLYSGMKENCPWKTKVRGHRLSILNLKSGFASWALPGSTLTPRACGGQSSPPPRWFSLMPLSASHCLEVTSSESFPFVGLVNQWQLGDRVWV